MVEKVLVLRTADKDRQSYGYFQWPEQGPVEAPDWDPSPRCGYGLHGALWGEGNGSLFDWTPDATWQVVEVDAEEIVNLGGKVKFPRGVVVYSGDRKGATEMILAHPGGKGRAVIGASVSVGDRNKAVVGYNGKATAGDFGTAIAGDDGIATAGYRGTATAGDYGKVIVGHGGEASVGNSGVASAGDYGEVTAGDYGEVTVGEEGMATAGEHGKISGGIRSMITIKWFDEGANRIRISVGYIGEDPDLKPDTFYRLNDRGKFIPA